MVIENLGFRVMCYCNLMADGIALAEFPVFLSTALNPDPTKGIYGDFKTSALNPFPTRQCEQPISLIWV